MKQLPNEYIGDQLSHATLRNEDLIQSFMDFLRNVKGICEIGKKVDLLQEEVDKLELEEKEKPGYSDQYIDPEQASCILNEDIWDLLNAVAPEFTYFGSTEGDGSDFGFWTDEESLWDKVTERTEAAVECSDNLSEFKDRLEAIIALIESHDR